MPHPLSEGGCENDFRIGRAVATPAPPTRGGGVLSANGKILPGISQPTATSPAGGGRGGTHLLPAQVI